MKNATITWTKINPAELSQMENVNFLIFALNGKIIRLDNISDKCVFTSVLLASANHSISIYTIDIWLGVINTFSAPQDFRAQVVSELTTNLQHKFNMHTYQFGTPFQHVNWHITHVGLDELLQTRKVSA
jgi:hypothetical protein